MSLDIQANIDAIRDLALETGLFAVINGHEPAIPLETGLDAAVWMQYIGPSKRVSSLTATAGAVIFTMRIYSPALSGQATPAELDAIDPAVGDATSAMIGLVTGDFTLGGTVFVVDLFGAYQSATLSAKAGGINVAGTVYRITDLTIPLIIDGVWPQGAVE